MPETAPFGTWKSPISAERIASSAIAISFPVLQGKDTYWVETRPTEGGRQTVVRMRGGGVEELVPAPYNVRTRVHEYGGLSYAVHQGTIYFSNFADQRLYVLKDGDAPQPLTPEAPLRYADHHIDPHRQRLLCVLEDHSAPGEAVNKLVSLRLEDGGGMITLAEGHNFYASPALSPDGRQIAWLAWNHPNMPWDGTELWLGDLLPDGTMGEKRMIAGGKDEAIVEPAWSPDGTLYFVAEFTGWWNVYRWLNGNMEAVYPMQAEFGRPHWVFGSTMYDFTPDGRILCVYIQQGISYLGLLDPARKELEAIRTPYTYLNGVHVEDGRGVFFTAAPKESTRLVEIDLGTNEIHELRRTSQDEPDPGYLSEPELIEFPTENGLTAFAFYYPPYNQDYTAPEGEKPPLIVISHGGPTSQTTPTLSMSTQFWTSRGFGVVDVNYGGSTGYGRAYRQRLEGEWGVVDLDDCVNAARHLVKQGRADGNRLIIRGGSAGGYTTLCAITFRDDFSAGASYFGIGELEVFTGDTHKFESRYMDSLIGPYPERKDLYKARSPINFLDQINCPVILFQGLEDKIVPPNQAEMMFEAVKNKGIPSAYIPFEGEQHGFRKAENIQRSLEAEYYFYAKVFGFELADEIEPVEIENLP